MVILMNPIVVELVLPWLSRLDVRALVLVRGFSRVIMEHKRMLRDGLLVPSPSMPRWLLATWRFAIVYNYEWSTQIINTSEQYQLAAIVAISYGCTSFLGYISNPSEIVQLAAVKDAGARIKHFPDTQFESVRMAAIENDPHAIFYIRNPTESEQVAAAKQNPGVVAVHPGVSKSVLERIRWGQI